jgi:ATP sulfurylase
MVKVPTPTRAEVNDIYNTILDGASGLVLAAETAIGKYPIECVAMTNRIIHSHQSNLQLEENDYSINLVEPHGGHLVKNVRLDATRKEIDQLKKIIVDKTVLLDCEQLAWGTYSPLKGFMKKCDLYSVLNNMKLSNGLIWTMPLILQLDEDVYRNLKVGDKIGLADDEETVYAELKINELYHIDLKEVAGKWFGTNSHRHPGVQRLKEGGNCVIAGQVTLLRPLPSPYAQYVLTPHQTRFLFSKKGWSKVVGFHTRNVVHGVHEFIQKKALDNSNADGLFISPVIGLKKKGDFQAGIILETYQKMLDNHYYPKQKVLIGSFSTYARYSGPREAIFTALCRKNMGCSHFIIGRDHTGVENFYSRDANRELFRKLGDIGIMPIFFDEVGYSPKDGVYGVIVDKGDYVKISGTQVRDSLRNGDNLPDWVLRKDIKDCIREKIKSGERVFH